MNRKGTLFFGCALSFFVLCSSAPATWITPVPVTEISSGYHEKSPFLSFDGLTLYFSRVGTSSFYGSRMFQATRAQPTGPFASVNEISTLTPPGGGVDYPWVSGDNLQMYYCYKQPQTGYRLAVSERESVDDPWRPGTDLRELNVLGDVFNSSLTADELTIFFTGYELTGGKGEYDIWTATRPNKDAPFTNITDLWEINSSVWDFHPSISPDGLTLHFGSRRNGNSQLFRTTRLSLDASFGSPERLSFFDSPDTYVEYPFLSADGVAFYFAKRPTYGNFDIYVSYIPEPATFLLLGMGVVLLRKRRR